MRYHRRAFSGAAGATLLRAGLIRMGIALAVFVVLAELWRFPEAWPAHLAAVLALPVAIFLMAGWPEFLAGNGLVRMGLDLGLVSMVVGSTGGVESPFAGLYFLAVLGAATIQVTWAVVVGLLVAVLAYLGAGYLATGEFGVLLSPEVFITAALVAVAGGVGAFLGMRIRRGREEAGVAEAALISEREYLGKAEELARGLGDALRSSSLEENLRWTAEKARELSGTEYVHVLLIRGHRHHTSASGEAEVLPTWWNPMIQRLVLQSSQSGEAVRSEEEVSGLREFVALPLSTPEGCIGALVAGAERLTEAQERVLGLVAGVTGPVFREAEEAPGGRDSLSGLSNLTSFHRYLRRELVYEGRLTVMVVDIEGFRSYNRRQGAEAGDRVISLIGAGLGRERGSAFRCGGDEFALVLREGSEVRARRISQSFAARVSRLAGLAVAVGYVVVEDGDESAEAVFGRAMAALERAKGLPERVYGVGAGEEPAGVEENVVPAVALALVSALEAHDDYLGGHVREVSRIARAVAEEMGLSEAEVRRISLGALLHDVGKIGVPVEILRRPGRLTEEEFDLVKLHPEMGERIVQPVAELSPVMAGIRHHHERYDGRGYPDGLAGEEIPLDSRVILAADALDTMVRGRPYRRSISVWRAMEEIEANAGTQFDFRVVAALRRVVSRERSRGATG